MKLSIISLKGVQFEGEAKSLNVKTTSGEVTILDHHRPLVTELVSGEMVVTKNEEEKLNFNIESGFLEFGEGNRVTVLVN